MKNFLPVIFLTLLLAGSCKDALKVASPDKTIEVSLIAEGGEMAFSASVNGSVLFDKSRLGIVDEDGYLAGPWTFEGSKTSRHTEDWTQPWGENRRIRSDYRELASVFANEKGTKMTIRIRVFDDGFGFRYEIDSKADSLRIVNEDTHFCFAQQATTWTLPANYETYELQYRVLPLSELQESQTPMTFRTESGVYGSIHEAGLYDYPEMVLRCAGSGVFVSDLAPLPRTGVRAFVPGRFNTPFRSVQISGSAVGLINSSLILNLNEPCSLEDVSWIRPQKYIGVWWGMHLGANLWYDSGNPSEPAHGATTSEALRYIDFAAANNIDGVLFEGWNEGWDTWGGAQIFDYARGAADFDVDKVSEYAAGKGVALWMHDETGGNIPDFEEHMEEAFTYYESKGVHTVKTGYAGGFKGGYLHHSQYGVKHYQKVVETAAAHKISIDAHEPIKATGIRRTWPNMMTREGARGMEWNAWSEGNSADYLAILPYVRLLGGPMDYTPGVFDLDYSYAREHFAPLKMWNGDNTACCIKTTLSRQIANWVVIYSPLQMACDMIENYDGHPAFQFFRDFNADCEWSRALCGEIGEYLAIARKSADEDVYYIGVITNTEGRSIDLPLDFLPKGSYTATVYADDFSPANPDELFSEQVAPIYKKIFGEVNPESCVISTQQVGGTDTLKLQLLPSGGAAVVIKAVK
ncbi:MAG: glycoside hydrolase family 97 protein [Bacteroidales bacterium]|nr:glycoside hydrolase family 97 protein [Bacteroidales bacterium]